MSPAKLVTTIRRTHGRKPEHEESHRMEEHKPVPEKLRAGQTEELARVTMSLSTKVTDASFYGEGDWDKIPWSVEVHCSVSLECDQTEPTIQTAQNIAYDLAWEASRTGIARAIVGHDHDIRTRLFPHLFRNPEAE